MEPLNPTGAPAHDPLFVHWTPFALDFSPWQKRQDLATALLPSIAAAGQRQQFDPKKPEFGGLAVDQAILERDWEAGRNMIQQAFKESPNSRWAMNHDERVQRGQQMMMGAMSPSTIKYYKEEEKNAELMKATIDTKAKEGAYGWSMTDPSGRPQVDPADPTRILTAGEYYERRTGDMDYNAEGIGGRLRPLPVLTGPNDVREDLMKGIDPKGYQAWASSGAGIEALGTSGMDQVVAAVTRHEKGQSNIANIMAGVDLTRNTLTNQHLLGIFNAYKDTPEFASKVRDKNGNLRYTNDGGFIDPATGELSVGKAMEQMMTGKEFRPAGRLGSQMGKQVTYVDKFIFDTADRFVTTASEQSRTDKIIKGDETGMDLSKKNLVNYFNYTRTGPWAREGPIANFHKVTSQTVPVPIKVDGKMKFGSLTIPVVQEQIPSNIRRQLETNLGVKQDEAGDVTGRTASDVVPGKQLYLQGGNIIDLEKYPELRLVGVQGTLEHRPDVQGNDMVGNQPISREGFRYLTDDQNNATGVQWIAPRPEDGLTAFPRKFIQVTLKGKVGDKDDIEDFIPKLDLDNTGFQDAELEKTSIADDRVMNKSGASLQSHDDGFFGRDDEVTIQGWIPVPPEWELDESLKIDARYVNDFTNLSGGTEQQKRAADVINSLLKKTP